MCSLQHDVYVYMFYDYVLLSHVQIKVKVRFNNGDYWMDACGQWWSGFRGYVMVSCLFFMILLETSLWFYVFSMSFIFSY